MKAPRLFLVVATEQYPSTRAPRTQTQEPHKDLWLRHWPTVFWRIVRTFALAVRQCNSCLPLQIKAFFLRFWPLFVLYESLVGWFENCSLTWSRNQCFPACHTLSEFGSFNSRLNEFGSLQKNQKQQPLFNWKRHKRTQQESCSVVKHTNSVRKHRDCSLYRCQFFCNCTFNSKFRGWGVCLRVCVCLQMGVWYERVLVMFCCRFILCVGKMYLYFDCSKPFLKWEINVTLNFCDCFLVNKWYWRTEVMHNSDAFSQDYENCCLVFIWS